MVNKENYKEFEEEIVLKDEERQRCEIWTRVVGYHRPISAFNFGKQGEFEERICFTETQAFTHLRQCN